ncbi:MAG: glycosyltransferase [Clostridiales bacterium]|nr:glycosyltransferase [Clostridiales bacterium]
MKIVFLTENYLLLIFAMCYLYQFIYIVCMLFFKWGRGRPVEEPTALHKFGVVIPARNEEKVIGSLIESINLQKYPNELISIFVVADNCTDRTAEIARAMGAIVFERNDTARIGKGYALNFLFDKILGGDDCEAYVVFDADNLASPDFLWEMNKVYCRGYRVILGYRNSKNYASNWVSAGSSLWFLRDSEYLNHPRMLMNTSCLVAGTGFLVGRAILESNEGWHYFSLTEDVEFTADMIIKGEKIGYCGKAVFFDEQPVDFMQSWTQRVRWAKGFYQIIWNYGRDLLKGIVRKRNFACFDMLMSIFPALLLTLVYFTSILARLLVNFAKSPSLGALASSIIYLVPFMAFGYVLLYFIGLLPTITEWRNIDAPKSKKILYTFTFPVFMLTFIPIAGVALFKKVEWEHMDHTIDKKINEMVKI